MDTQNTTNKVIFVSRLDKDCSLGADLLCNIAHQLATKLKNPKIIIIGGGTEFDRIYRISNEINAKINRELIEVVGNVQNPREYFTDGALFVGVSRAALEAMSKGLAVILLGNEGYLGLLDENNLQIAIKTNFTCRNHNRENDSKKSLKKRLFEEIIRYFALSSKEKEHLSTLSQKIITENYTADKMATRTLKVYKDTIRNFSDSPPKIAPCGYRGYERPSAKHQKIALCGYYGHGNLGDEAILQVITKHIQKSAPCAHLAIINPKSPIEAIIALQGAKLFIFGGGSLLQNATSDSSLLCYLMTIRLASALCNHKIMLSNGFGPIIESNIPRDILLQAIKNAVDTFDYVSVRDRKSQKSLQALLPNKKIDLIPDPVYELLPQANDNINKNLINHPQNSSYIVYIPNSRALHISKLNAKQMYSALTHLANKVNASLLIAVMNNKDVPLAKKIFAKSKSVRFILLKNVEDLCEIASGASLVITQRYHGALVSLALEIPTLALSTDPKIISLGNDFDHIFENCNPKIIKNHTFLSEKVSFLLQKVSKHDPKVSQIDRKSVEVESKIDAIIKYYL